jgi:hypothetical protein
MSRPTPGTHRCKASTRSRSSSGYATTAGAQRRVAAAHGQEVAHEAMEVGHVPIGACQPVPPDHRSGWCGLSDQSLSSRNSRPHSPVDLVLGAHAINAPVLRRLRNGIALRSHVFGVSYR